MKILSEQKQILNDKESLNKIIILLILVAIAVLAYVSENLIGDYPRRLVMLFAINVMLAIGLNIIFGFAGMFSLGHYGFMTIGAYVAVILSLSPEQRMSNFYVTKMVPWLENVQIDPFVGILIGGFVAAFFAILIGIPILKSLGDDYLGIATLGFAEIIRVVITNLADITNGPLGIKGLPKFINVYWVFGFAIVAVIFAIRLGKVSSGRALKAIRENEIAAEASGIGLLYHKVLALAIGSFFAGVGGALLGYWTATIDPKMFTQVQNFTFLTIIVTGGKGNITGTVIMSFIITIGMEVLRFVEEPMNIFGLQYSGIPGTRMLTFSVLLLIIILKFQRGIFKHEFSPRLFYTRPKFFNKIRWGNKK